MKKKVSKTKKQPIGWNPRDLFILLGGILFLGLMMIQEPNFSWMGSPLAIQNPTLWGFLLVLGLVWVAYGLYRVPTEPVAADLSKRVAYSLLFVILAVAAYIRMFRADEAYSGYWADPGTEIADVRDMIDKHVFHIIFPGGGREPFYSWVAAAIWWCFPAFKALLAQRLTSNLINLVTIWLFYRVGREWTGKRLTGVLFAALGAASKPLILLDLSGMRVTTATFGVSLMLLGQVKLFQKKNLKHFLVWGAFLAASLYTYTIVRVLIPFLVLLTLIWVLRDKESQKAPGWIKAVCWVLFVLYFAFYCDSMLGVFYQNLISKIWASSLTLWFLWQCAFAGLFIWAYNQKAAAKAKWLLAWGMGLLLVGILSHPIALHPESAARISGQSLLPKSLAGWFSSEFIHNMSVWVGQTFSSLFYMGRGRSDMTVLNDCFFEFHAAIWVAMGLLYALVRPTPWKTFLVALTLVALVPYLLTTDLHAAKLLAASVPLLLLAALVMSLVVENFTRIKGRGTWPVIALVLGLLVFWGWELQTSYVRVYDKWWWEVWNDDVAVGRQADRFSPTAHVYLVRIPDNVPHPNQFFDTNTQSVLHDVDPVYLFQPVNPIPVRRGEAKPNVVVLVSPLMKPLVAELKKEFPLSTWEPTWQYYQKSHNETPFLYTVQIPTDEIPDRPGKLFYYVAADPNAWIRRTYISRMCMREGVIDHEDASLTLNPFLSSQGGSPISMEKNWIAPEDGDYTFTLRSGDSAQLMVDGKEIFTIFPGSKGFETARLSLKKGVHQVHIAGYMTGVPALKIENKSSNYLVDLGS